MVESQRQTDASAATLPADAGLQALPGIGPKLAVRLAREGGLHTLADLCGMFPRRVRDVSETDEPHAALLGSLLRIPVRIVGSRLSWLRGRRSLLRLEVQSGAGALLELCFFNQPYLRHQFAAGTRRMVEGRLEQQKGRWLLAEGRVLSRQAQSGGACQLRYPELPGIGQDRLRRWVALALERLDPVTWPQPALPQALQDGASDLLRALRALHQPESVAEFEQAREHFALREALGLLRAVEGRRQSRMRRRAQRLPPLPVDWARDLPFTLTQDQQRAVARLGAGLDSEVPAGFLLQGDVGAGKTVVALACALQALAAGVQVALMAPTELLAEQHAATLRVLSPALPLRLLTGSTAAVERGQIEAALADAEPLLLVGTHALFSAALGFARLGLVIIDEQHRFGVAQRQALQRKGRAPHLLAMSATPIPQSLAQTLYGDLDLCELRSRPPGTRIAPALYRPPSEWPRLRSLVGRHLERGGQVFVVCPRIGEDGEKGGVLRVHADLAQDFACGLVHGRMPAEQRQEVLQQFRAGAFGLLCGTTVLEVGVDVPGATLMLVLGCERFGLATLHQLRGRVGRGPRRGLCVLSGDDSPRVRALCASRDGFALAEEDLRLRGAGEVLGNRQSGLSELRCLDPLTDLDLLRKVRGVLREEACGEASTQIAE